MRYIALALLLTLSACAPRSNSPMSNQSAAAMPTAEQIQQNMMEAGKLRPEHALLRNFVGSWRAETKFWMNPNGAPEVSKGTAEGKLLYGGRYVSMSYKGKAMGQPFTGEGLVGFNNMTEKYFSTWIDSMSTAIMTSEGVAAPGGKSITLEASFTCPMTRQKVQAEDAYTFLDKNHFRFESFEVKDGQRLKHLEINYTRRK